MPDIVFIATGSEVALAMAAAELLARREVSARVVSMPCAELFIAQEESYRESVLPSAVTRRVAIEAGSTGLWHQFIGPGGRTVGLDRFGKSAPAGDLFEYFGFTPEKVAASAMELLEKE